MSLQSQLSSLLTRVGTEFKSIRTLISGTATGDVSGLTTTATDLVAAINEVKVTADAAGAGSGDLLSTNNLSDVANAATALGNLGGLSQAQVDARVQLVVDSAPAALDTLNELAAALGDDANFAATTNTALGNRVRFDAVQSLTAPQQTQAQDNLQVYSRTQLGDPETDLTAVFVAALA